MARRSIDASRVSTLPPASPTPRALPYDMLKKAILSGELAPGQPMVETPLAEWCGVSRTPIREAFRRLEQDGLIHHKNGGLVVRERSPEDILDVYETRIVLEATAARVAAERRTDHDIQLMRVIVARGRTVSAQDAEAMVEVNNSLHQAIWRASRNESLVDALERLKMHLGRYPERTLERPGRWAVACQEHDELVDAIERRYTDVAHAIATKHFTEARDIRLALFAESQAQG